MRLLRILFVLLLSLAVDGAGPTVSAVEAEIDGMEEAAHRGWPGWAIRPGDAPAAPRAALTAASVERRSSPAPVARRRAATPRTTPKQPPRTADSSAAAEDH
jgi:hypothetical protein